LLPTFDIVLHVQCSCYCQQFSCHLSIIKASKSKWSSTFIVDLDDGATSVNMLANFDWDNHRIPWAQTFHQPSYTNLRQSFSTFKKLLSSFFFHAFHQRNLHQFHDHSYYLDLIKYIYIFPFGSVKFQLGGFQLHGSKSQLKNLPYKFQVIIFGH
jgi:hypothetical protein